MAFCTARRARMAATSSLAVAGRAGRDSQSSWMPRKQRLTRVELSATKPGASRRIGGEYFFLTVASSLGDPCVKMTCVVSKKVSARANIRNLIKRRCRNIARPLLSLIKGPCALIFSARREAAVASFSDLKRDIEKLLARV